MVEQNTDNQYDDDLTIGTEDYGVESYSMDDVDLFEFSSDDDSPISRLKTLVLSIDWEITDDVLRQFNEELTDLKDIWAGKKYNLVYVQALEKISKYIYQKKADAHPNAIKLLLSLYYNLEKIETSEDLSDAEKKQILLEDVAKFEGLKKVIGKTSKPAPVASPPVQDVKEAPVEQKGGDGSDGSLLNLKAIVLGIDWEITDQDLNDLREEVIRLEEHYSDNRPVLILLQGIGTLGAYIKVKKSNAHADAFKVLHLFYDTLEKITSSPMGLEEVKGHLFPAVERFNAFKALLGSTISPDAIRRRDDDESTSAEVGGETVLPALSDVNADDGGGFQAEEEARALGLEDPENIAGYVDTFFTGDTPIGGEQDGVAPSGGVVTQGATSETVTPKVDRDLALQGVDVEFDDEEVEESDLDVSPVAGVESSAEEGVGPQDEIAPVLSFEGDSPEEKRTDEEDVDLALDDADVALRGVDVETEADDDSDEEALPLLDGELAPALADSDETSLYNAETLDEVAAEEDLGEQIAERVSGLFGGTEEDAFIETETIESGLEEGSEDSEEIEKSIGQLFGEDSFGTSSEEDSELFTATDTEGDVEDDVEQFFSSDEAEDRDIVLHDIEEETSAVGLEEETTFRPESEAEADSEIEDSIDQFFSAEPVDETESSQETDMADDEDTLPESSADSSGLEFVHEESSEHTEQETVGRIHEVEETQEPAASEDKVVAALAEIEEEISEPSATDSVDEDVSSEFAESVDAFFAETPDEVTAQTDVGAGSFRLTEDSVAPDEVDGQDGSLESAAIESTREESDEELLFSLPDNDLADEEEVVFELVEDDEEGVPGSEEAVDSASDLSVSSEVPAVGDDELAGLELSIESLGLDLDETVIQGVFQEIQNLRQKWSQAPLQRIFLQLLSTVAQHIDTFRYESSSEAYPLMCSIFRALKSVEAEQDQANHELLLDSTLAVLQWQQDMLAKQVVERSGERTFFTPVRGDDKQEAGPDLRDTFNQILDGDSGDTEDEAQTFFDEMVDDDQLIDSSVLTEEDGKDGDSAGRGELRDEIAVLRKNLKDEIDTLRKELKGDS